MLLSISIKCEVEQHIHFVLICFLLFKEKNVDLEIFACVQIGSDRRQQKTGEYGCLLRGG